MTQADKLFIETCKKILDYGVYSGTDENIVRTRWDDGSVAGYYSIVGVQNVYDVSEEFPMVTLRKNYFKSALNEILWIFLKKSNKISDLKSHVWDKWADENGTIGKAYGYQLSKEYLFKTKDGLKYMDQVDYVLYLLKNDRYSRRIMTNLFNHEDLKDMNLEPCAYGTQWLVKGDRLNLILNQRSQDMLAANAWNVMQYTALLYIFAKLNDLKPGLFIHQIGDCHIYDRHVDIIKEIIKREPIDCSPKIEFLRDFKDFYDFKESDIKLVGYKSHPDIKNIEVAI